MRVSFKMEVGISPTGVTPRTRNLERVDEKPTAKTRLARVMNALGLKPIHVLRAADRIARSLGRGSVSRQWFSKLRSDPAAQPTADKIWILVAAFRELTGRIVTAADLVDVEPALPQGARGTVPSLSPVPTCKLDGSNASVPVSSGLRRSHGWRPPLSNGSLLTSVAFETLYAEYAVPLRGIAIHRYHIPPDEAEELVHEAFIAYLQRHTAIRDVKGWIMGTMRFKCSEYWRARKREAPLSAEQEEAAHPTAEQDVRSAVAKLTVASAIRQLGENCRETIRRFYWLDESLHDIAACYATTENNVKQMLFTCRRRMRDFIARHSSQQP